MYGTAATHRALCGARGSLSSRRFQPSRSDMVAVGAHGAGVRSCNVACYLGKPFLPYKRAGEQAIGYPSNVKDVA